MIQLTSMLMVRVRWDALAYLRRAGRPVTLSALTAAVDRASTEVVRRMAEVDLVTIHQAGAGTDAPAPKWLTSPGQLEVRLTLYGEQVGDRIVQLAGALLLLSRHKNGLATESVRTAAGLDNEDMALLLDHQMIEAVDANGEPARAGASTHTRITRKGRMYTTESAS